MKIAPVGMCLLAVTMAGGALAHTTVVKKNTHDKWQVREEIEGSSSVVSQIAISHGCDSPAGNQLRSVKAMSVVWPNGADALTIRVDTGAAIMLSDEINGNAIMSPRSAQNKDVFKKINQRTGPVPEFNSHGLKDTDVRAFHYRGGSLQTDLFGLIPYRASYPTFKSTSCVTKMKVKFAIANYCTRKKGANKDNRADIWIGRLTEKYNDPDVVSVGFWPQVDVVRDLNNNPLAGSCGEGYSIEVSPSDLSIDKYLPMRGFWPKG